MHVFTQNMHSSIATSFTLGSRLCLKTLSNIKCMVWCACGNQWTLVLSLFSVLESSKVSLAKGFDLTPSERSL